MKKLAFIICFFLSFASTQAQDAYNVNGELLQLKTEIDGNLDLLWNIIDGKYRYFIRTSDNTITELVNTKGNDNKYQEEYKNTLQSVTKNSGLSAENLNLTLYDLKKFVDTYNSKVDSAYQSTVSKNDMTLRLGIFGGITNNPFIKSPENETTPQFGLELEVLESNNFSRHALFMQLRHVLENDSNNFSTTEIALGYRFRFINSDTFSLYGNMTIATVNFYSSEFAYLEDDLILTEKVSETDFEVPLSFGLGADIKITDNSFITLGYNELFAVLIDNQGEFSTNITVGYKLNL